MVGAPPRVDFYFDPVCPYAWIASRWLVELERQRALDLRYHVMSLRMLNDNRVVDPGYRRTVDRSIGPSRVATAAAVHFGEDVLPRWYTAFGDLIFDHWRYPEPSEYRDAVDVALERVGLPSWLGSACGSAGVRRRAAPQPRGRCQTCWRRGGHPDRAHRQCRVLRSGPELDSSR
jgi:hypothetical protein